MAPATNDKNRFWFASSFSGEFQTPRCRAAVCVVPSPDVSVFPVLTICSHDHWFLQIPVCDGNNNIYKIRVPCHHGNIIPGLKPFLKSKYIPRTSTFVSVGFSLFSVGRQGQLHYLASIEDLQIGQSICTCMEGWFLQWKCFPPEWDIKSWTWTENCIPWVVW